MALWPQFIGPAYRARSQNIADDALINLYPEFSENPAGAKQATYYGTPGLKPLITLATQGSRGWFSQDGRTFGVDGDTVYAGGFSPSGGGSVQALLVAGGGAGGTGSSAGNCGAGGGGGGGVLPVASHDVTGQAYAIVVGAGGTGGGATPTNGSDSSFDGLVATGGGAGGQGFGGPAGNKAGSDGGAGGGGGGDTVATEPGGTGVSGQGFAGGAGFLNNISPSGGGGGGAGAIGTAAMNNQGGNGGAGLASTISGASVTYGGGGAGAGWTANVGTAGAGGGGAASITVAGTDGTANLGGGGGAGINGGNGGTGTVILSYVTGAFTATGGTITTSGGRTIHTFTASGTFTVVSIPSPSPGSDDFAAIGTIPNDGLPVSFASNGRGGEQVALVGGGQLKIINLRTNTLSAAITLPLTNAPVMVDFLDGYFVLSEANTIRVWFSALEDGTSWDALDFFAVSLTSSNVVGIKVFRDRIWVFQSQSSLVYYDSGDADNPFVPYPGSVMQEGCVTPWAIVVLGEQIFWLAQDNQGRNRIVSAVDYAPVVISTPPISFALASYSTTADCEVLAYEQEGHPFVCWTFPTGDQAWCYDTRTQQWHERSTYDATTGLRHRWRARGSCATETGIIVGDAVTGDVYTLDLDTFTDNGATIQRLRRTPYLSAENQWMFIDRFELGIQSGVGLVDGREPELMLSLSRDSGYTWTPPTMTSMGAMGNYLARAIWRKLGRVRADRLVIEVTQTDPVRAVWGPGAWIKARAGSGQL